MTDTERTYRPLLDIIREAAGNPALPEGCPDGGHVVPCVVGCELGAQPIRPLIWTTSGWRMVAE